MNENKTSYFNYGYDINASYNFSIDDHNLSVFAGFQIANNSGSSVYGSSLEYHLTWTFADLSSATGPQDEESTGSWQYINRSVCMIARAEYDYNEKYLASLLLEDGSTSFGENKFGIFPSDH